MPLSSMPSLSPHTTSTSAVALTSPAAILLPMGNRNQLLANFCQACIIISNLFKLFTANFAHHATYACNRGLVVPWRMPSKIIHRTQLVQACDLNGLL